MKLVVGGTRRRTASLILAFGSVLIVSLGCSVFEDSECEMGQTRCVDWVVQSCEDHRWVPITDCFAIGQYCGSCDLFGITGEHCCHS